MTNATPQGTDQDVGMAERIPRFDWANTELGPLCDWPDGRRQLLDMLLATPLPMCILWGEQALQLYNDAHAELIGDQHPTALGRPAADSWGSNWSSVSAAWACAYAGQSSLLNARRLRMQRSGNQRQAWFKLALSPIRFGGPVEAVLLCLSDSTEQVMNEARLNEAAFHYKLTADRHRLSEQRLQLALEASDLLGIWDWDLHDDRYRHVPDFFTLSPLQAEGADPGLSLQNFLEHVHPLDRERILAAIQHCIEHSGTFAERYRTLRQDGEVRWAFARGRCHYDEHGRPLRFPGAVMDITRQHASEEALRQSEAELRELNETLESRIQERTSALAEVYERLLAEMAKREQAQEALRQSQKMEAVGQLTGGIAHDFNNLLTGIIGALDLMRLRLAKGREDGLECLLDTALGSSHRAAALTQRLLAFSRRQSLERRPTPINPLVRSLAELLQRSLSEQVSLVLDLAEDAGLALADANQLESALLNLCLNARDAMPDGGTLHLETRPVLLDVEEARRLGGREGRFVRIRVRDSGIGIPAPLLGKVFEPFFTTKPLGQGTGLGLSMVYGFVQQSEGFIGVDSQPGAGTCFTLHMPATLEGAAAPRVRPRPLPVGAGAGQRILLVEDDEAVRALLQNTLEDLGYQVHLAEDGTRALALLERLGPLDLLLSDVGLPGLDGRQLADVARRLWPGLPVILMTGYAEQARVREAFLGPGMRMLNKPFALERLAEAVAEACAEAAFAEAAYAEAASDRAPDPDAT